MSSDFDTEISPDWEVPFCVNHPETPATRVCRSCQQHYCLDCINVRSIGPNKLEFCPACGQRCRQIESQSTSSPGPHRRSSQLPLVSAFSYPLKGNNWAILAGGAFIFGILQLFMGIASAAGFLAGIFGLFVTAIITSYIAAFSFDIIRSSSQGESDLPGWPDLSDILNDLIVPLLQFIGVIMISFGPYFAYRIYQVMNEVPFDALAGTLLLVGIFYAPMALLAVGMSQSLLAANPLLVITSLLKIPGPYLLACLLLGISIFVSGFLQTFAAMLPFLGTFLTTFIGLYFLVAQMRILGLTYYHNRRKLGWFKRV